MITPSLFELSGTGQSLPHFFENEKLDSTFIIIRTQSKEVSDSHDIRIAHFVNLDALTKDIREQIRLELRTRSENEQQIVISRLH